MIRRVLLRNWRSHRQTELVFSPGTNLLVGPMGAGKTSVVEAVCFALYGTFPALQRKEVELEEVITRGEKNAAVELELELDGRTYGVRREFGRRSRAELRIDGKLAEAQPRKVTAALEDALKADYEVFARAVYAEQNGIDELLRLSPKDRKKKIDEVLGIRSFEEARQGVVALANKIKGISKELAGRLAELKVEELEKEVSVLKSELTEAKAEEKRLAGELEKLRAAASERQAKAAELEKKGREARRLREELEGKKKALSIMEAGERAPVSEAEVERLEREHAEAAEKTRRAAEARERAEADKNAASRALGALEQRRAELTARLNKKRELEEKKGELGVTHAMVLSEIEKARVEVEQSQAFLAVQSAALADLRSVVAELAKEGTACPVCESPLPGEKRRRLLSQKKEMRAHIEATIAQKTRELEIQKRELASLEKNARVIQEIEDGLRQLAGIEEELERAGREAAEAEKRAAEAAARARKAAENENEAGKSEAELKEALRKAREALEERRRAEKLRGEVAALEDALKQIVFDERELERARAEAEAARVEVGRLEEKISGMQSLEKERARLLEMLEEKAAEAGEVKRRAAAAAGAAENAAVWENALLAAQAALRENYVAEINAALELIWPVIYPYGDFVGARVRASEEDYSLELKAGSEWIPVEGRVSGGERACAALALRIAFATVLVPNLSWLFLDEPTHNLDAEGVAALAKALREEVPKVVAQAIVITHEERLRAAAGGGIYVLSREKAAGGATVAEAARELALI